jgi:hypothetical protein
MSEKLTARRAPLGQNGSVAGIVISFVFSERETTEAATAAKLLPCTIRRSIVKALFVNAVNIHPCIPRDKPGIMRVFLALGLRVRCLTISMS